LTEISICQLQNICNLGDFCVIVNKIANACLKSRITEFPSIWFNETNHTMRFKKYRWYWVTLRRCLFILYYNRNGSIL